MECLKTQVQKRENEQRGKGLFTGQAEWRGIVSFSNSSVSVLTKLSKYSFCEEECYDPASVLVPLRYFSLNLENT